MRLNGKPTTNGHFSKWWHFSRVPSVFHRLMLGFHPPWSNFLRKCWASFNLWISWEENFRKVDRAFLRQFLTSSFCPSAAYTLQNIVTTHGNFFGKPYLKRKKILNTIACVVCIKPRARGRVNIVEKMAKVSRIQEGTWPQFNRQNAAFWICWVRVDVIGNRDSILWLEERQNKLFWSRGSELSEADRT